MWLIGRLHSFSRSFTWRFYIYNPTNICWGAIENLQTLHNIWHYLTAIPRIVVRSQISMRAVEELPNVHNVCIDHVSIWLEPKNINTAKVAGTVKWNGNVITTHPETRRFQYSPGNTMSQVTLFVLLRGSWAGVGHLVRFQPGPKLGNLELLLILNVCLVSQVHHQ